MKKLSREKSHLATKKAYKEGMYSQEEDIVFRDGLIVKNRKIFRQANINVMGDIEIIEEGELIIEHTYCNIKGKLYIHDKGKLICKDTLLRFNPTWIFEIIGELYDNSSVELVDTTIDTNFVFAAIRLHEKSQADLQNVRPETNQVLISPWFGIEDESRAILRNCYFFNPGWGNSMFARGKSYAELHNCVVESFFPREIEGSKISFINVKIGNFYEKKKYG